MKKKFFRILMCSAFFVPLAMISCNDDDAGAGNEIVNPTNERYLTIGGALMQTEPGDGNGGMMVYSVKRSDAINPNHTINVFDQGFPVKSARTARIQSSNDGKYLYNIQYTGADGGVFNKYQVNGGDSFSMVGSEIRTDSYVGTSPRWAKAEESTGIAVNIGNVINLFNGEGTNATYLGTKGTAAVISLDLNNPRIKASVEYDLRLSAAEEVQGYHIFRLDAPVVNKAGNKAYIGTWMRKINPETLANQSTFERLGTKTVVVDYPSLQNPRIITSTISTGDNSGYRSPMSYVASDGNVYQATHRENSGGSYILKIGQNNEYDNSYNFSLDQKLGVTNSYIETWKYAGNGIGYAIYSISVNGSRTGGYIARLDLNNKTATKVTLPNEANLDFSQYQGITVVGDEVFVAVAETGQNGNIYVINSRTNQVTKGAQLINKPGNRYIGIY
ncbi:hypothetical protein [Faecalibacter bovis]|uniref:DUF4374 domain-containing protein n=1 Tax=Faecalibacter bovis TaxID=2898187 RepID=A0ABX7XES7_9FLAO|nr:hypothetical protein [Faecalibacter bovis]QTV06430.1 hypothetical protein J9309_03620 [Faecalibacter bovis]